LTAIELTIVSGSERETIVLPEGENLRKSLLETGIHVQAVCGGAGGCGKCRVRVVEGLLEITDCDRRHLTTEELTDGWRLSCAAHPAQSLTIEMPPRNEESFSIVSEYGGCFTGEPAIVTDVIHLSKSERSVTERALRGADVSMEILQACSELVESGLETVYVTKSGSGILRVSGFCQDLHAIAVDVGTTTLCLALVNVADGRVVGHLSMINGQREYGADVISRIRHAVNGGLPDLSGIIRGQIARAARKICEDHRVEPDSVVKMAIAGNTSMLHILLGLSCRTIGAYPFTPVTLDFLRLKYGDIFPGGGFSCAVDLLPGLSAYVGADIASGILFVDLFKSAQPAILLDMGTNGEMALSCGGRLYCTSTAAGPAFEGGNIQWGTGSVPGAISSVKFLGETCLITTIDGEPPCGICGSGVIDTVAECLAHEFIAPSGRFERDRAGSVMLGVTSGGEQIRFTQKDVREVQLGKSAIRSGIDVLVRTAGLEYGDIGMFYVAGGFGSRMNFENGVAISLFPQEFSGRMRAVGNSALGGLVKYLTDESAEGELEAITRSSAEFDLSEDKAFNKMFIANMSF